MRPCPVIQLTENNVTKSTILDAIERAYADRRIDPYKDAIVKIKFAPDGPLCKGDFQGYLRQKYDAPNGRWTQKIAARTLSLDAIDRDGLAYLFSAKRTSTSLCDYLDGHAFGEVGRRPLDSYRYFDHKFLDEHSRVHADGTRYDLKYANDLETSLFGDKTLTSIVADFTKWEDMHSELDDLLECEISGVNTNYFYIARQGSMAPVHVEDFSLFSINIMLPGGKPKIWLAFSQQYMQRINDFIHKSCQSAMLRSSFCANHLRHKCFIISWQLLEHLNIPYTVVSQEGSTCIISLPGGYHQTYATGISYSEAKNFLIQHRWLEVAMRTPNCDPWCEMRRMNWDASGWDPLRRLLHGGDLLLRVNTACVRRTMPLYDFRQGFNCDAVLVTNKGNDKRAKRECNKLEMHLRQAMSAHREHNDDSGHATESSDNVETAVEILPETPPPEGSRPCNPSLNWSVRGTSVRVREPTADCVSGSAKTIPHQATPRVDTSTREAVVHSDLELTHGPFANAAPGEPVESEEQSSVAAADDQTEDTDEMDQGNATPDARPPSADVPQTAQLGTRDQEDAQPAIPARLEDLMNQEPIQKKLKRRDEVNTSAQRKRDSQSTMNSEDRCRRKRSKPTTKTSTAKRKRQAADQMLLESDEDIAAVLDTDPGHATPNETPSGNKANARKGTVDPSTKRSDPSLTKMTVNIKNWDRDTQSLRETIRFYASKDFRKKFARRPLEQAKWDANRQARVAHFQGRLELKNQQLRSEITTRIVYRALKKYYSTKYKVDWFADRFADYGFTDPRQIVALFWTVQEEEVRNALFFLCVDNSLNDFMDCPERYDEWRTHFTHPSKLDEFFGVQRELRVPANESTAVAPPTDLRLVLDHISHASTECTPCGSDQRSGVLSCDLGEDRPTTSKAAARAFTDQQLVCFKQVVSDAIKAPQAKNWRANA